MHRICKQKARQDTAKTQTVDKLTKNEHVFSLFILCEIAISTLWRRDMKHDQEKAVSIGLMEEHYLARTEKSAIHRPFGGTLSRTIRKKRYPSALWRHIFTHEQQKATSIGIMEAHFHVRSGKSGFHRPYGGTFSRTYRKKRHPSFPTQEFKRHLFNYKQKPHQFLARFLFKHSVV
jgi:hypothetical protein